MTAHALLSASASERWLSCPGSVALCRGLPDKSSKYADGGTEAHEMASRWLLGMPPGITSRQDRPEMVDFVEKYVDFVNEIKGDGQLLVEQRVDYSSYIGVRDSFGTSDAIIISSDGEEICVIDFKYGMGISVDADHNPQLQLYALGALNEYSALGDFKRARMIIHQPRLHHISEWSCSIAELLEFGKVAKMAALVATSPLNNPGDNLHPSVKGCRWCKASATCPALARKVEEEIEQGFDDITEALPVSTLIDELSAKMKAIPLIEVWCKAVRAEVERRLTEGEAVEGFKLVRGKMGNRKWTSETEAENALKLMRYKREEMYSFNVISPTAAEKLLSDNPRRWAKIEALITRSEGKLSVAPLSDKREAIDVSKAGLDFDVLSDNEE